VALIVFNDEILDKVVAYIQESEKFFCWLTSLISFPLQPPNLIIKFRFIFLSLSQKVIEQNF
jgi:hypothetical protein